ncbi:MAG: hypothetical protein J0M29_12065 [Chitinophagales bacterium]|nr:hypothetical protein [Chitinophagales bacterium]
MRNYWCRIKIGKMWCQKKIEPELAKVCEKWPEEWEDCPDGKYEWEAISAIDIAHNIFILDSLRNSFEIKGNAIDRMIVIHEFDEGFNSWYRETFFKLQRSEMQEERYLA